MRYILCQATAMALASNAKMAPWGLNPTRYGLDEAWYAGLSLPKH